MPAFLLDFVFDTTKAITLMLLNGTFRDHSRIRFVFAHMGGVAPFLGERLALGYLNHRFVNPDHTAKPVGVQTRLTGALMRALPPERIVEHLSHARETLSGLYYDTAVSALAPTVAAVKELAGAGRIVYGTDFPAGPEPVSYLSTRLLAESGLTEAELARVERQNALELFGASA
jgi:predicted TIM-barrel fold metal-dependent hydrolase